MNYASKTNYRSDPSFYLLGEASTELAWANIFRSNFKQPNSTETHKDSYLRLLQAISLQGRIWCNRKSIMSQIDPSLPQDMF